jgi:hypothetical protein
LIHNGDVAIEHSSRSPFSFLQLLQEFQQIDTVLAMHYSACLEGTGA